MGRVAIITGATGGLGREFVKEICHRDDIDEVWAVGRNSGKLETICKNDSKIKAVEADLAGDGVDVLTKKISEEKPDIRLLVNNAGVAYMGQFEKMETDAVESFCRINCSAPAQLISVALPYMHEGSGIINVSSASSFQPNPYLSMYSASKVFLKNFSRALGVELKDRKITVTCLCPGWVDTGMLPKTKDGKEIKYSGMLDASYVVKKALKDFAKGKDMSVPGFFAGYFRIYSKVMPTKIVMKQWLRGIKDYV